MSEEEEEESQAAKEEDLESRRKEALALPRKQRKKPRKASDFGRNRSKIDVETAKRVRRCLKAACINETPLKMFSRYDKDRSGDLDSRELTGLIRRKLKIPPSDLSNRDVFALIKLLDADKSGTLAIAELAAFVDDGIIDFKNHRSWGEELVEKNHDVVDEKKRIIRETFDRDALLRLRQRLRDEVPLETDVLEWLRSFDENGDGELSSQELGDFIRRLNISDVSEADLLAFVKALDMDGDESLSLEELADFLENGLSAFGVSPASLGKAFKLGPPKNVDNFTSQTVGYLLGTLRARLGAKTLRDLFHVSGVVGRDLFQKIMREKVPDLSILEALFVKEPAHIVDLREVSIFLKRGAYIFDFSKEFYKEIDPVIVDFVAKQTFSEIQRSDLEQKIQNVECRRLDFLKKERANRSPAPGPRVRPRPSETLFQWLDDIDKESLLYVVKGREALRHHEDCGQPLAVAATLVNVARSLSSSKNFRELDCAGDAFYRAHQLLSKVDHSDLLREATEAYVAAFDLTKDASYLEKAERSLKKFDDNPNRLFLAVNNKILRGKVAARRNDMRQCLEHFTRALHLIEKNTHDDSLRALATAECGLALDNMVDDAVLDPEDKLEVESAALHWLRVAAEINKGERLLELRRRIARSLFIR